jgi:hypothetical protein
MNHSPLSAAHTGAPLNKFAVLTYRWSWNSAVSHADSSARTVPALCAFQERHPHLLLRVVGHLGGHHEAEQAVELHLYRELGALFYRQR